MLSEKLSKTDNKPSINKKNKKETFQLLFVKLKMKKPVKLLNSREELEKTKLCYKIHNKPWEESPFKNNLTKVKPID